MISPCGFILICVMNVAFISPPVKCATERHLATDLIDSTRKFYTVSIVFKVTVCRGGPFECARKIENIPLNVR